MRRPQYAMPSVQEVLDLVDKGTLEVVGTRNNSGIFCFEVSGICKELVIKTNVNASCLKRCIQREWNGRFQIESGLEGNRRSQKNGFQRRKVKVNNDNYTG